MKLAGGKVTGILWYQGESDASPKAAPRFQAKFENLVAAFRADLGQAELPFYYVQIGRHVSRTNVGEWNQVQEMQRLAARAIPHSGMAPAVDLSLDDGIHVGTQDHKRLGRRLANLALGGHAISPVSARMEGGVVRVVFSGVNGRLQSRGRISGFTIHDSSGSELPAIFRADFDAAAPDTVVLHVSGSCLTGPSCGMGRERIPIAMSPIRRTWRRPSSDPCRLNGEPERDRFRSGSEEPLEASGVLPFAGWESGRSPGFRCPA